MNAREKVTQAAILGALYDQIGKVKAAVRVEARIALAEVRREHGVKSIEVELADGTVVASVSLTQPKSDQLDITDEPAFLQWVAANYPEQLRVDYAFKRGYLKGLDVLDDGTVVSKHTGEVVPHAAMTPAAKAEPTLRILYTTGAAGNGKDLIAQAWRDGTLPAIDVTRAVTAGGDS